MVRRLLAVMVGFALLGGFAVAEAGGKKGKLVLRVNTHEFATFDRHPVAPDVGFAFYVSGDICKDLELLSTDCVDPEEVIGEFHCWGWDTGTGLAVVSQEFNLFDRGKIQVQGVEDEGPRAVVGGTGEFRNVRGEATGFDLSKFLEPNFEGEFIATFKLIGAGQMKRWKH